MQIHNFKNILLNLELPNKICITNFRFSINLNKTKINFEDFFKDEYFEYVSDINVELTTQKYKENINEYIAKNLQNYQTKRFDVERFIIDNCYDIFDANFKPLELAEIRKKEKKEKKGKKEAEKEPEKVKEKEPETKYMDLCKKFLIFKASNTVQVISAVSSASTYEETLKLIKEKIVTPQSDESDHTQDLKKLITFNNDDVFDSYCKILNDDFITHLIDQNNIDLTKITKIEIKFNDTPLNPKTFYYNHEKDNNNLITLLIKELYINEKNKNNLFKKLQNDTSKIEEPSTLVLGNDLIKKIRDLLPKIVILYFKMIKYELLFGEKSEIDEEISKIKENISQNQLQGLYIVTYDDDDDKNNKCECSFINFKNNKEYSFTITDNGFSLLICFGFIFNFHNIEDENNKIKLLQELKTRNLLQENNL